MLWISDPKALQYVYQTSGYNFPKQPERRILSRLIGDTGLTWAEGANGVASCGALWRLLPCAPSGSHMLEIR